MRFQKLPAHTTKYVMPLVVAMFMSFIMSGIITYKNVGFVDNFVSIWLEA